MSQFFKRKFKSILAAKQKYFQWVLGLSIFLAYAYLLYTHWDEILDD